MTSYRARSPPPRRHGDPRASTGAVYASPFDARGPRYDRSYGAQPLTRRTYLDGGYGGGSTSRTAYPARPRQNSIVDENRRPSSALVLLPPSPPRSRPVVMNTPRERPRSPVSRPQQPRDSSDRHLYPSAADPGRHHQRHYSATPAEMDRLVVANRDGRERGGYHRPGGSGPKSYTVARPPIRYSEDEGYSYTGPREQFARDYPAPPPPKRDNPAQLAPRRDSQTRRERPLSVVELPPDWKPPPAARKEPGPPSASTRQFDRLERPDPGRLSVRPIAESDAERSSDMPRRRHSMRNPVVHQTRDDDYTRHRDEPEIKGPSRHHRNRYDDEDDYANTREHDKARERDKDYAPRGPEYRRAPRSRDNSPDRQPVSRDMLPPAHDRRRPQRSRESSPDYPSRAKISAGGQDARRSPRSRDASPERAGIGKGVAAVGLGGVAAAGLANGLSKDSHEKDDPDANDRRERRRRRHREREKERVGEPRGDDDAINPRDRGGKEKSSSDSQDEQHKSRRHHRRRHRSDRDSQAQENQSDSGSDRPVGFLPRDAGRNLRDPTQDDSDQQRIRERGQRQIQDVGGPSLETRTLSPGEDEDGRPRRVQLVEPVKDSQAQGIKPRGILKAPRAVPFPEDPNPIREGVAPLNAAGKEGVPVNARWTKISRVLVNPEALLQANERYEERDDYVIVLRVISKEEIAKLAEKTREIRETREREWEEELEERKKHSQHHNRDRTNDESEREREREREHEHEHAPGHGREPLAIEPPAAQPPPFMPQPAPLDPRVYQNTPDPLGRSIPEISIAPTADVVPETYSENV